LRLAKAESLDSIIHDDGRGGKGMYDATTTAIISRRYACRNGYENEYAPAYGSRGDEMSHLLQKHMHVTICYTITVSDDPLKDNEEKKHFLTAVLANEEVLKEFLASILITDIDQQGEGDDGWQREAGIRDNRDILAPAVQTLSGDEQAKIDSHLEAFDIYMWGFDECFQLTVNSVDVTEKRSV